MARTALTTLQDQIEAVRREAFAAGYAAAMQAIRELTGRPAPSAAPAGRARRGRRPAAPAAAAARPRHPGRPRRARAATPAPRRAARAARTTGRRPARGTNARLIEEVLQSSAPRALRPAEIRTALQRDKGVQMAFTSIRHALGQLEERHTAEQVAGSKTWRFRAATPT